MSETSNSFIDMFLQKCVVSSHHLKYDFANTKYLVNILHMYVLLLLLLILYLSILDFINFPLKSKLHTTSKYEFLPLVSIKMLPCLKLEKLIVYLWESYKQLSCVKIIKKNITQSNNTFGTGSVCFIIFRFRTWFSPGICCDSFVSTS